MRKIDRVYVHCSDSVWGNIVDVTKWHTERGLTNAQGECGYHYIIYNGYLRPPDRDWHPPMSGTDGYDPKEDGKVVPARAVERPGAHVAGANKSSIGICLIGKQSFTPRQFESLKKLVASILDTYELEPMDVLGHREYWETRGETARKTCPNFPVEKLRNELGGING